VIDITREKGGGGKSAEGTNGKSEWKEGVEGISTGKGAGEIQVGWS